MTTDHDTTPYSTMPCGELLRKHPYAEEFFTSLGLALPPAGESVGAYFGRLTPEILEDLGIERRELGERFSAFMALLVSLREKRTGPAIESFTIQGGVDKSGAAEAFVLTVAPGEVVSIVGPTGSGKSRFLADIEWMAQGDTPTRRRVLINGSVPDPARRFSLEHKLVAQLSQNMNFVMDLSVEEFIAMHAESRMVSDVAGITRTIIEKANELAGEGFSPQTPVTALSGGQSRALMIADTSCLSTSPIVLIDEIENAGIDRKKAVSTLVDGHKIVLMATHDPILALMGDRRLVFRNGGVRAIIATTPAERAAMAAFEEMDARLTAVRNALRNGEQIVCV
jgi:ABC-type lipoprotein export system ATPase subunit